MRLPLESGWAALAGLGLTFASLGPTTGHASETGSSASAILGGQPTSSNAIFATVAIRITDAGFCSGALIAPNVVLTAGHCVVLPSETSDAAPQRVQPERLTVVAGALTLKGRPGHDANLQYEVKAIHLHPDFDTTRLPQGQPNDLAVLELNRPVATLIPVPLFPEAQLPALTNPREPVVLAGYGCRDLTNDISVSGDLYEGESFNYVVTNEYLHVAGRPGVCKGDSGGPAYIEASGRRWVLGITSASNDDGTLSFHVVPSRREQWIRSVTNNAYSGTALPVDTEEVCVTVDEDEVCTRISQAFGACNFNNKRCAFGLSCYFLEGSRQAEGRCLTACTDQDGACPEGSTCRSRTQSDQSTAQVCLDLASENEPCGLASVCDSNLTCSPDFDLSETPTCRNAQTSAGGGPPNGIGSTGANGLETTVAGGGGCRCQPGPKAQLPWPLSLALLLLFSFVWRRSTTRI